MDQKSELQKLLCCKISPWQQAHTESLQFGTHGVVRPDDQSVDVRLLISLGSDLTLDHCKREIRNMELCSRFSTQSLSCHEVPTVILSLVGEDNVHLLRGVSANVGTEHDRILRVSSPLGLVNTLHTWHLESEETPNHYAKTHESINTPHQHRENQKMICQGWHSSCLARCILYQYRV